MTIKWHIFATIILIQLKSFHCNTIELSSYSRVAKNGNGDTSVHTDKPLEVHRAREGVINSDLWQPKTEMHDSDTVKSTGRTMDDNRRFPFPLKDISYSSLFDKVSNHQYNSKPNIVYASSPVSQIAQDRFVPRESLSYFLQKNNNNRIKTSANRPRESDREDDSPKIAPSANDGDGGSSTDFGPNGGSGNSAGNSGNYIPPKNLYSFPPNIDASYAPPRPDLPSPISVSSYLPPASGPTNYPIYPSMVNPPLQPTKLDDDNSDNNRPMDSSQEINSAPKPDDSPAKFRLNKDPSDLTLDPAYLDQDSPDFDPHDHSHDHGYDHHHHHHHDHHDDHHAHHPIVPYDSFPYDDPLKHLHGYDAVPEVLFDHPHHDHGYFHDHHPIPLPPPPPPSTPPPPPPPPIEDIPEDEPEEQPRVKKYSYFYLARSLWYIPLYFTVWFTFYVTWLILQSIGRHQVALPNHTVNRRSVHDLSHRETVEKVNVLTEFVMSQIEDFKEKHL